MSSPLSIEAHFGRVLEAAFAAIEAESRRRERERQRIIDRLKGKAA